MREEKDFSAAKKAEFVYIAFGISRDVNEERTYGFEVETEQKGIAANLLNINNNLF